MDTKELLQKFIKERNANLIKVIDFYKMENVRYKNHYLVNCLVENPHDPVSQNVINDPMGASFVVNIDLFAKYAREH